MSGRLSYPPLFVAFYLQLLCAAAGALYTTSEPSSATLATLFWGGLFAAGLLACRRATPAQEEERQQFANVAAGIALVLLLFLGSLRGVETGLLFFLFTLQAGRNLALFSRRDFHFGVLVSLVLILYAAGKSTATWHIIFPILYALAGVFSLMAEHIDSRLAHARGGDVQLLRGGLGMPARGVWLTVLILASSLLIYLVVPHPASPRLQAFPASSPWSYDQQRWEGDGVRSLAAGGDGSATGREIAAGGYPGLRQEFDLADQGLRGGGAGDALVLHVQAATPLYLRGRVFDRFDGRRWSVSEVRLDKRNNPAGLFVLEPRPAAGDSIQVITLHADHPPVLLAAYRPVQVAFPGPHLASGAALTLHAPDWLRRGTVYSVSSRVEFVAEHLTGGVNDDDPGETEDDRYLAVPEETSPRLRSLSRDLTRDLPDDFSRAAALEGWLRDNHTYTRATMGTDWTTNPVETFLFDLKSGHCELFAASLVVMLRTLDIPARMATGYVMQRYNPVTGYYEVRTSDGHAWVEAWLPPHGWVTFEPTPSFESVCTPSRPTDEVSVIYYLDNAVQELVQRHPQAWWSRLLQQLREALLALGQGVMHIAAWLGALATALWDWLRGGGWLISMVVAALAGGIWHAGRAILPWWRLQQLRWARHGDSTVFMRRCFQEMERHFTRYGAPRSPHLTPGEYSRQLSERFAVAAAPVSIITRQLESALYGPNPVTHQEVAASLQAFETIYRCHLLPNKGQRS